MERKHEFSLAGIFLYLTKQYIGILTEKTEHFPATIGKYYYALYIIWKHEGEINQQTLAEFMFIDKVSLVRVLDALCDDGYIQRQKSTIDKRMHMLVLTEKAKPYMPEIEKAIQESNATLLNLISKDNQASFKKGLDELITKTQNINANVFELLITKV